jgi:hypothetical protein
MNPPEPLLDPAANVQVSTTGHKLPEQAQISKVVVPRPVSMSALMYQWQPMGIRVLINLPFTGNDEDFLFIIRNGPFIPYWSQEYDIKSPDTPTSNADLKGPFKNYAWNNMRNVLHGLTKFQKFPDKFGIFITQYDLPPILSTMATAFRRWRGDMQYRIRTVAGFATQGYVFVGPLKNYFQQIAIFDEYNEHVGIQRQDNSYREVMQNSYVLGDTSMFRHFEVTQPYEYPVPWYDQHAWIQRRIDPNRYISPLNPVSSSACNLEPHGDNFLAVGLRGNLAASQEGAQIEFELEYRAVEGFQFADPFLLPKHFVDTHKTLLTNDFEKIKRIPDPKYTSDGLSTTRLASQAKSLRQRRSVTNTLSKLFISKKSQAPSSSNEPEQGGLPKSYSSREREFSY